MSQALTLPLRDSRATLETVGGKGASLARMVNAGFPVPEGFHITTEAYRRFIQQNDLKPLLEAELLGVDPQSPASIETASKRIQAAFMQASIPQDVASAIAGSYGDLAGSVPEVAVRSSATAEDLPQASFAGQQESYLNVSGADNVLEATKRCWSSLWTARAISYRLQQGIESEGVALAVVVQRLVPAEVAGVLFTVSPVNGNEDQVLISASWGLGDAIVGGRVTPDDYTVDKKSRRLVKSVVADKEFMTVRIDGATEDQPVPENLRLVPVLEQHDLSELTRLGVEIEELYGQPMDIEWALADGEFAIVQARPITTLPGEETAMEVDWPLPDPKARYMRASIVDLMPDPLSPLFATMGVSAYNDGLQTMLTHFTGKKRTAFPPELIVPVNDYAYFLAGYSAGEWWALLSGLVPRMYGLIRKGPDHFRQEALPQYQNKVDEVRGKLGPEPSAGELWQYAHTLIEAAVYHLAVLQVDTLGAAAGSEGLFTATYNRFLRRNGDPDASAFLMGYDTAPILSEKSLYDLAQWVVLQQGLASYLSETQTGDILTAIEQDKPPVEVDGEIWNEWQSRLREHIQAFGYILYNLDFAEPVPAEDPTPSLEIIKVYLRGEGADPHQRQSRLEQQRLEATQTLLDRARGPRGWVVRKALGWAQAMAEVREDSIASIGLAYPLLRELLRELGLRFIEAGAIQEPEDIYWLEEKEIEESIELLDRGEPLGSFEEQVDRRKTSLRTHSQLIPPTQLPPSDTYMGISIQVFVPGEGGQEGNQLKGVAASRGRLTGTACVLHGPEDFDEMQQGGILVAKMTTPAWTPLFAMAGGVVTDIGGPLSHGSIVAREYGIPAVLGTATATRVIQSGQTITVDGDAGLVILEPELEIEASPVAG